MSLELIAESRNRDSDRPFAEKQPIRIKRAPRIRAHKILEERLNNEDFKNKLNNNRSGGCGIAFHRHNSISSRHIPTPGGSNVRQQRLKLEHEGRVQQLNATRRHAGRQHI